MDGTNEKTLTIESCYNLLKDDTSAKSYANWLVNQVNCNIRNPNYQKCKEISDSAFEPDNQPFASILVRTQGRRPESLRETLLCIRAQTDQDYEVILVGHKLDEKKKALVETIISEQEECIRTKIRFVLVDHGGRTVPLNYGFAEARGKYVMIFDDDDIVMNDWLEEFHKLSKKSFGKILHAYSFKQYWSAHNTDNGEYLRAENAPSTEYFGKFNMIQQVEKNSCPPIGLAFPSFLFKELGFIFDESLNTAEDWDYLMRTSSVVGVSDSENPTSIYRWWINAESSQTVHNEEQWKKDNKTITEKIEKIPILMDLENSSVVKENQKNIVDNTHYVCSPDQSTLSRILGADSIIYRVLIKLYEIFLKERQWGK